MNPIPKVYGKETFEELNGSVEQKKLEAVTENCNVLHREIWVVIQKDVVVFERAVQIRG
jgi:hypothetical protein